jgi:hypothetical protein
VNNVRLTMCTPSTSADPPTGAVRAGWWVASTWENHLHSTKNGIVLSIGPLPLGFCAERYS